MEGRREAAVRLAKEREFQSAPPAWRGDLHGGLVCGENARFNPRPPAWRGDRAKALTIPLIQVSIRAPRVEGRPTANRIGRPKARFNPRPPRGGATGYYRDSMGKVGVSIRAPRVEGRPHAAPDDSR